MDPVTALCTIIQLIGVFRAEKASRSRSDSSAFLAWLVEHKHNDLKQFISDNSDISSEVATLLQRDHDKIREDIRDLNSLCASIAQRIDSISGLASTLPESRLSDQALKILCWFVDSGGSEIHSMEGRTGLLDSLIFNNATHPDLGGIKFSGEDARFLRDDLETLVDFGLLSQDFTPSGDPLFRITRACVRFVDTLDRSKLFSGWDQPNAQGSATV